MQIVMSGATGFIGTALLGTFIGKGWLVKSIDRQSFSMNDSEFLEKKIEGSDVVIHLAGAPILHKWTDAYKEEIYQSRINTTKKIVTAIKNANAKPGLFISGSAIGIYNTTGTHTEGSNDFADDFMAKVCKDWEYEALEAIAVTRVVIFRTGVVLGKNGGALLMMQTPFKYGLGGKIGNGRQPFSWIALSDIVDAYIFAIENSDLSGIVNAVSPYPVTNQYFTQTFAKVLNQPAFLSIPSFALKMVYGEGAQALTTGQNVLPEKLLKTGFVFQYPTIEKALMALYK